MPERGVVTLCDANYFPGLLALHASIRSSTPVPVACFDIGLSDAQRAEAAAIPDLLVLDLPDDPLIEALRIATADAAPLKKPGKRIWPLWICPLLIAAAPFAEVFWLDCDLLVLRGLDTLFAMLADGPVFTPENMAPHATPNPPRLYELMPIARAFDPLVPTINAGVSGWRRGRDDALLDAYLEPVRRAASDRAVREAIAWHDQGALIWAIQSLGYEHRVLTDTAYNRCIVHANVPPELLGWDAGLVDRLRLALPDIALLHWNGRKAPWLP
jgi:hypothetical protein